MLKARNKDPETWRKTKKIQSYKYPKSFILNRVKEKIWKTRYDIIRGVQQGSILGTLLFNLFINGLFFFSERTNICNFAGENNIYRCDSDLETVLEDLQHDMKILLNCFNPFSAGILLKIGIKKKAKHPTLNGYI